MSIVQKILSFFKNIKDSDKKKEKSPTLFDTSQYERPGHINYKRCPQCKIEANTNKEVESIFGLMNVGGHIYIQSWCKECRKKHKSDAEENNEENLF